jgi:hypothetical protein
MNEAWYLDPRVCVRSMAERAGRFVGISWAKGYRGERAGSRLESGVFGSVVLPLSLTP